MHVFEYSLKLYHSLYIDVNEMNANIHDQYNGPTPLNDQLIRLRTLFMKNSEGMKDQVRLRCLWHNMYVFKAVYHNEIYSMMECIYSNNLKICKQCKYKYPLSDFMKKNRECVKCKECRECDTLKRKSAVSK